MIKLWARATYNKVQMRLKTTGWVESLFMHEIRKHGCKNKAYVICHIGNSLYSTNGQIETEIGCLFRWNVDSKMARCPRTWKTHISHVCTELNWPTYGHRVLRRFFWSQNLIIHFRIEFNAESGSWILGCIFDKPLGDFLFSFSSYLIKAMSCSMAKYDGIVYFISAIAHLQYHWHWTMHFLKGHAIISIAKSDKPHLTLFSLS